MTTHAIPKAAAFGQPKTGFRIPYLPVGSVLGPAEVEAVTDVATSGRTLSAGPWRERFESDFRDHVGAPHALSVTSGTVALELAIHLLDLRPGDEVVVTPQTYQASAQPLLQYPDVRVRFCDVDRDTLNMDPACLQTLLGERTRAVILVHYGGLPAPMREITAMARARGAVVIEDAAHALGSVYHGRRPGSLADIGCFSFHTSKNITTLGEGGMLTFFDDAYRTRVERLRGNEVDADYVPRAERLVGADEEVPGGLYPGDSLTHDCVTLRRPGTNATLSEAASAVGVVQLRSLEAMVERRRAIAARLREVLEKFGDVVAFPEESPGVRQSHHLFTFFVRRPGVLDRNRLLRELTDRGVQVPVRYFPLHLMPEWRARGHRRGECPVAERLWFTEQVNLPCHPGLSDEQVELLCSLLFESVRATLRRS
ncbi:DegT/DnrJ/EryC1/StrS aminotransferase family protein [Streptomyces sp. JJ38]|uniref:DegT/DnrJ/EryC1/StrS family aminotransferase n=1 Tax=Streptomyces sp. JJ38 TaxID=2738128 RepID=UPI001C55EE9B|nr:DegT/DnrJ/EryC1/StrS family aminotransferase [Streptomyces sp. JJ38]MBW1598465.1 DegT/DnrJ/EryC1/StrS family aminotransferase [Streptomyces sp. JJ38]